MAQAISDAATMMIIFSTRVSRRVSLSCIFSGDEILANSDDKSFLLVNL